MRWFGFVLAATILVPALQAVAAGTAAGAGKKELNHVVLIKFKPAATPEQIKKVEDAFAALREKVPGVTSLRYGTNVSPENKNKGYTHVFILTFATEKDRDGYLIHPAHKAFGGILGQVMDDVLVVDFWSQD
ncbi:MAG TPA: Dabb family protein [Tepidisphaeraceae bacterium]|jgi:hypothetical protein